MVFEKGEKNIAKKESIRKKLSDKWNYEKHFNEKSKNNISESMKRQYLDGRRKSYWLNKKLTEERKSKLKLMNLGENNSFYGKHHSIESKKKISQKNKGLKRSNLVKLKMKEKRKLRILPVKDTTIEVKMQNFLKELNIEFVTHQYMKDIEHGYQCDIMIPVQEGIEKKTIIECYGNYWHNYPVAREIDNIRCTELRKAGWRVLVFWESEIRPMELQDLKLKMEIINK